jgi:signal transduction histidine kinase
MDADWARARATALAAWATSFATGTTNPPPPRARWLRAGRYDLVEVADALVALICFLTANAWLRAQDARFHDGYGDWTLTLIALVTCAPLVLRTRAPLTAWLASGLAILGSAVAIPPRSLSPNDPFVPATLVVYGLCLYAVTVRCAPRIIVTSALATVLAGSIMDPRSAAATFFLTIVPVLVGVTVRTRRNGTRRLAERLREQELRHSDERALLEERQRIARELHDVVAHHMSVIAIQAEAAPYKCEDPPAELVESFTEIRASALTGLNELRRVLGVLRADGPASAAPQPSLADLDALVDSARGGGVTVTAEVTGDRYPLPEGVDLSAYRILQEALSNAMRHAPGSRADVRVGYHPDCLQLEVLNGTAAADGPAATATGASPPGPGAAARSGPVATAGGGHGLIGMRERAAMLGGTLFAAPLPGGGFRVSAVLPVHPADAGNPDAADPDAADPGTREAAGIGTPETAGPDAGQSSSPAASA